MSCHVMPNLNVERCPSAGKMHCKLFVATMVDRTSGLHVVSIVKTANRWLRALLMSELCSAWLEFVK
jgi:hypothetical protein